MPTVFERTQVYYSLPNARQMTKKQYRTLCGKLKQAYDKGKWPPYEYVDSVEEGGTFRVRDYPAKFQKLIDGMLWRFHKQGNFNRKQPLNQQQNTKQEKNEQQTRVQERPKRKRIPLRSGHRQDDNTQTV